MKRERGQYVKTLVNEGAGKTGLLIGVVTSAGPKQYAVCWENGARSRYGQGHTLQLIDWSTWPDDERRDVQDRIYRHCQEARR